MVVAAIRDISVRRKIEDDLRQEVAALKAANTELDAQLKNWRQRERSTERVSEQYRSVFEQGAAGIAVTATDGRFLQVNQWFCNMTGYVRDELLQLRISDITHPDDVAIDLMLDAKMLQGGAAVIRSKSASTAKTAA